MANLRSLSARSLRVGDLAFSFQIEIEGEKKSSGRVASARAGPGDVDLKNGGVGISPMAHFEDEPVGIGAPKTRWWGGASL